jgi:hypothetical protein
MMRGTKAVILTMVLAAALLAVAATFIGPSSAECCARPVLTWHTAEHPL